MYVPRTCVIFELMYAMLSGKNRQRSKGPTRPERLCILYDERPLRPDRLSAAIEQRLVAHQVAIRHQDERHV